MGKKGKQISWAENECRIACKRENPEYDFDSDDFDYGCSCYKSALKAYNALAEDEHSGTSWSFTRDILIRLMNSQPLTPITEEDFKGCDSMASKAYLKERGLKSEIQCPRYSALFRSETLDGKVSYHDVDRAYFIDIENPSDTFGGSDRFLDDLFPITLPYTPSKKQFKIYVQHFLCDEKNGDYDTKGILYIITPDEKKIPIDKYMKEVNGVFVDISKEEYEYRLKNKRIDKINKKASEELMWTLVSNSSSDEDIMKRENAWRKFSKEEKDEAYNELEKLCMFFDDPENYKYNTFSIRQALCGEDGDVSNLPKELVEIRKFLQDLLLKIKERYE